MCMHACVCLGHLVPPLEWDQGLEARVSMMAAAGMGEGVRVRVWALANGWGRGCCLCLFEHWVCSCAQLCVASGVCLGVGCIGVCVCAWWEHTFSILAGWTQGHRAVAGLLVLASYVTVYWFAHRLKELDLSHHPCAFRPSIFMWFSMSFIALDCSHLKDYASSLCCLSSPPVVVVEGGMVPWHGECT